MYRSILAAVGASTYFLMAGAMPAASSVSIPAMTATGTPGVIPSGNPAPPPYEYPNTGNLTEPEPMPYQPAGGINTNTTSIPVYHAFSDFDWQSLNLALHQEYIELDLFQEGLRQFPVKAFTDAGLTADDRSLIEFMAQQEIGHAALISNMLGPHAPKQCEYQYPFTNVAEFIDFCQKLTRFGEAGVYGFLEHLDSRAAAQMVLQSITTEARQQMIFRQFEGLFPMPEWFQVGITQSMAWTLLAPYIKSCPAEDPLLAWQNFPALLITNNPNGTNPRFGPAVTHNRTTLTYPGREVTFEFEAPGKKVGWNDSYTTSTTAGAPLYAAWLSQLNVTYTPLYDITNTSAKAVQPDVFTLDPLNPTVNGTMFVMLTDMDLYVTPHNITMLNPHVRAGPALYQSD